MDNNIAILIPSCSNYSDMRPMLEQSYNMFWHDCKYKIYLIKNDDSQSPIKFIPLNVGEDVDRSSNCIKAINSIESDYIMLNIDDLMFNKNIDSNKIAYYINNFIKLDGNYIKLLNIDGNMSSDIIEYKKTTPYRASTVFSLWKKEVLLDVLQEGENPWQFEVNGTERSKKYNRRFYIKEDLFAFENLVIKRQIERMSMGNLQKLGYIYTGNRKVMSIIAAMNHSLRGLIFGIIMLMPDGLRNKLVQFARKIG